MNFTHFKSQDFYKALQSFFKDLNIPVNYVTEEPVSPQDILSSTFKTQNPAFQLMNKVYFLGLVDDAAFEGNQSISPRKIETDYDGILIFGVTLNKREADLLPTRSQLAEITRAFNREFHYTPVVVVFKYENHIAFANAERQKYKQEWREGEKAGKVSLLRDIDINKPHSGHERILLGLQIKRSGKNSINSFDQLYKYWQSVFSVSILNKAFFRELSNWYFWAMKEVFFPGGPVLADFGINEITLQDPEVKEHNAKNLIRLLTRILFVWFIKEKDLIPPELFDEGYIKDNLLREFEPQKLPAHNYLETYGSRYYRAILQNLFFATLNQTMGERGFRIDGRHRNVTNLMRYKSYFKNPDLFIKLVEDTVPFMNGGLFECLDQPDPDRKGKRGGDIINYQDGFSDKSDNKLMVPDHIFFDTEEQVDLSEEYGSKNKANRNAAVKGLINILNSYKFTITENTPIEEDIALDPELLGKVFENLLASYNPETKTTARKQTGSFYTPREIVNYMVDESLIAFLKNELKERFDQEELDEKLHQLFSFDNNQPFQEEVIDRTIAALNRCSILDPACGSGAFPMGILQKMVHLLHKLDPGNEKWKQRQIDRVEQALEAIDEIEDADFRNSTRKELKDKIKDIEEAFSNNELDYGRKLYLIENCIYGVDIQAIASQISKLRFFISLIVDQKVDKNKPNFGVRPLPNLETKFVAANTLIGIEKQEAQISFSDNVLVGKLEEQLKKVRHKLFSSKDPRRKRELREEDKNLREQIATLLEDSGMENKTARQLASWDPYDQNASSPFFDSEWMFGLQDGFDIVIGNPPYMRIQGIQENDSKLAHYYKKTFQSATGRFDLYVLFSELGMKILKTAGTLNYIMPHKWINSSFGKGLRNLSVKTQSVYKIISFVDYQVFNASTYTSLIWFCNRKNSNLHYLELDKDLINNNELNSWLNSIKENSFSNIEFDTLSSGIWNLTSNKSNTIFREMNKQPMKLKDVFKNISTGIQSGGDDIYLVKGKIKGNNLICYSERLKKEITIESGVVKPLLKGDDVKKYCELSANSYVIYPHFEKNGKTFPLEKNEFLDRFPLTYKYLFQFKAELVDRKISYKTNPKYWYALHRSREISMFEQYKIITPEISLGTNMTLDYQNFYHNTKCYSLVKNSNIQEGYKFWIAILNSSLMWFFLISTGYVLRGGFFTFKTKYLEPFPLPILVNINEQRPFEILVNCILFCKEKGYEKETSIFESVIDGMVFELYFAMHMKETKIDILKFVHKELMEVLGKQDFENLTDDKKEKLVNKLHQHWTFPDNEVRNRIKLFAVRSPDILKPILESK